MTATVIGNILEPISEKLTFNVMICEDNCTGTGTGWDQSNYLSGTAGYEDNPYYNQPAKIVGYHHMKVVRAFLGGAWGVEGEFANAVKVGDSYQHVFTYKLPDDWKIDDIFTVGVISVNDGTNKEFLNSCYGINGPPREPVASITSSVEETGEAVSGGTVTRPFTLKNLAATEDTYNVTVTKSDNTPSDWTVSSSVNSIKLAPGAEGNFDVSIKIGTTKGFGAADVLISSATDQTAPKAKSRVGAVSADIEYFEVINTGELPYSLETYLSNPTDYIKVKAMDIASFYDKLPNLKTVIWNTGEKDMIKAEDESTILGLIDNGVNILFIGYSVTKGLNNANILSELGMEYFGYSDEGYYSGAKPPYVAMLSGVENDIFTSQWFESGFGIMRNAQYLHAFKITDNENVHPSMTLKYEQTIKWEDAEGNKYSEDVGDNSAIVSAWLYKGNSKIMIIGLHPNDLLSDLVLEEFMVKPLEWFDGTLSADDNFVSNSDMKLNILPNPIETSAEIYFELNENIPQFASLSIYNSIGQEVALLHSGNVNTGRNFLSYKPDLLPNGAYFLVLKSNNKMLSIPLIINK
jgi:hypothetical protein